MVRTVVGYHRYDTAVELVLLNPHRRAERHQAVTAEDKTIMDDLLNWLNPAAINARSGRSPPSC